MVFKGLIAATAAIALATTPVLAQTVAAPATETVAEDSEMFGRGGFIIPLIAVAVVILGILVLVDDDEEEPPVSA